MYNIYKPFFITYKAKQNNTVQARHLEYVGDRAEFSTWPKFKMGRKYPKDH